MWGGRAVGQVGGDEGLQGLLGQRTSVFQERVWSVVVVLVMMRVMVVVRRGHSRERQLIGGVDGQMDRGREKRGETEG